MNYDILIKTISEMVNNDLIYKEGLSLTYNVDYRLHRRLDEHFYYKANGKKITNYEPTDEFEVEMGGIIIKFVKNEKEE